MLSDFQAYPIGHYIVSTQEIERATGLVGKQLSKAGLRLAQTLNAALSPDLSTPIVSTPDFNLRGGRELALGVCSVCHMVKGDPTPTIYTDAPDFHNIANTRDMSPVVLQEFLFGPHPTMPSLHLSPDEANDVIGFIMSLRTRP